jgi:hypothetical protein
MMTQGSSKHLEKLINTFDLKSLDTLTQSSTLNYILMEETTEVYKDASINLHFQDQDIRLFESKS